MRHDALVHAEQPWSDKYAVRIEWAISMSVVWIKCPTTDHRVSTGRQIEQESYDPSPAWTLQYTCMGCGQVHSWADVSIELVDEPSPSVG